MTIADRFDDIDYDFSDIPLDTAPGIGLALPDEPINDGASFWSDARWAEATAANPMLSTLADALETGFREVQVRRLTEEMALSDFARDLETSEGIERRLKELEADAPFVAALSSDLASLSDAMSDPRGARVLGSKLARALKQ